MQATWGLPTLKHTSCQQLPELCHLPVVQKDQNQTKQIKLIKKIKFSLAPISTQVTAQEGVSAAPLNAGIHSQQAIHSLFNMTAFPIYLFARAHGCYNVPPKLTSQVQVELLIQDASAQGSAGLGQPPGFQFCWTLPGGQAGWCTAQSLSRPGPWVCGSRGQELTRSPSCSARGAASSPRRWAASAAASSACSGDKMLLRNAAQWLGSSTTWAAQGTTKNEYGKILELYDHNKGTPRRALKYDAHNLSPNFISQNISNCAASTVPYDLKRHENHIKMIQSRIKIIYVIRTSLGAFSAHSHVSKYPVQAPLALLWPALLF